MGSGNFIDHVRILCRSGRGGSGSAHLRREKYVPRGGPDGGDGGRGGDVVLVGDAQRWTLLHLRYSKHALAGDGEPGGKQRSTGSRGRDVEIVVPLGTVARDAETGEMLCEVLADGERQVLLAGGRGGLGNWHFRSATRQTPRFAQPGEEGKELSIILELKLLADVGLVGFPNAGKSTLLASLSAARPKIADYPFTTLEPNLGIVQYRDYRSFVLADIPGIIEGAHEGRGLGLRFLRHIERNSILLFVLSADTEGIQSEYQTLLHELEQYNPELLAKRRVVAVNKCDLLDAERRDELRLSLGIEEPHLFISALTGEGLVALRDLLWQELELAQTGEAASV